MEIGIFNKKMERPLFNPSMPKGKSQNPARRIQLRSAPIAKTKHEVPKFGDFMTYCKVQYFRLMTLHRWFKRWIILAGMSASSSSTSSSSAPSYLFADSTADAHGIRDDDDYSLSEIAPDDDPSGDVSEIKDQVEELEEMSQDRSWGEIQTRKPMIQPPRRDSELKHFVRSLMTAAMFHKLQACRASGHVFPDVQVPRECEPPFDELPDMVRMIVDLVNVTNKEIDAGSFFYEMYLDYIEYQIDEEECEEFSPYFVLHQMTLAERRDHEREQVAALIRLADRMLCDEIDTVIGLQ